MALLEWRAEFDVGDAGIDGGRRRFAEVLNALHESLEKGRGGEAVGGLLARLESHAGEHFGREESFMASVGHVRSAEHAQEHAGALASIAGFSAAGGGEKNARAALEFLKSWFSGHVIGRDLRIRNSWLESGGGEAAGGGGGIGGKRLRLRGFDALRLGRRVALLAAIPLLVILVGAGAALTDAAGKVIEQRRVLELLDVTEAGSALVHEVQKERGGSALFLGSKGERFKEEGSTHPRCG